MDAFGWCSHGFLGSACCNSLLQIPPEIFFRHPVRWPCHPLWNLPGHLLKPDFGMLGMVVLLEGPTALTAWCFTYDFWVVLSSTLCRFPTPAEPKQLQSNAEPPPCFTVGGVGQGFLSVDASVSWLHTTLSLNIRGLCTYFWAHWSRLFLCFWSVLVYVMEFRHGSPQCLTMQIETSLLAVTEAWYRLFAVTQRVLTTCLVKNLVAVDNFLFLLHPLSVTTSFNLKLANFSFPFPWLCNDLQSFLCGHFHKVIIALTCNQTTQNSPSQSRHSAWSN